MQGADRVFEIATGWKLRNTRGLPKMAPVTWRDTTRGVLGNTRYQLYVMFVMEVVITAFCLWQMANQRFSEATLGFMVATFVAGTLASARQKNHNLFGL